MCSEGTLGIIDHDVVEVSNLQRQILHTQDNTGIHKAVSAANAIKQFDFLCSLSSQPLTSTF